MKNSLFLFLLLILCPITINAQYSATTACPTTGPTWTINGYGSATVGGCTSGRTHLVVDTLTDVQDSTATSAAALLTNKGPDGKISFREALFGGNAAHAGAAGARLITFSVSGNISLGSIIELENGNPGTYNNLTIDGGDAPNGGVQIITNAVRIRCSNVIVRYMKFRHGETPAGGGDDALAFDGSLANMVVDHSSLNFGGDGDLDITNGYTDFTVQFSLFGNNFGSGSSLIKYAGTTRGTLFKNLWVQSGGRAPKWETGIGQIVNNVVYRSNHVGVGYIVSEVGVNSDFSSAVVTVDVVKNYYKAGPGETIGGGGGATLLVMDGPSLGNLSVYLLGNIAPERPTDTGSEWVIAYNWVAGNQRFSPIVGAPTLPTVSATQAYTDVTTGSTGATLPCRDSLDASLVADAIAGASRADPTTVAAAGGFPNLTAPCATVPLTLAISTSRQIVANYTAPNTSACTIEVSESPSYSPLVNDVNPTLFTGSNSDSRTGSLGAGTTARTMVIGAFQQPNGILDAFAQNRQVTDGVTNNSTTFTSATANFSSGDVGREVILSGGSVATNVIVQIVTINSASSVVLNRNPGTTATGITAKIGKFYTRVLKVNTTHYVRVTCGTATGTGSIATKNRPLGMTFDEPMPIVAPGVYAFPTLNPSSRSETVLDPQFGTALKKVSITADNAWAGSGDSAIATENGAQFPYAQTTINDSSGTPGYLQVTLTYQGFTRLYWTNPSTGESRHLGYLIMTGGGGVSGFSSSRYVHVQSSVFGTDPRNIYNIFLDDSNNAQVIRCQLPASGNAYYNASVPNDGTTASCAWSNLTAAASLSAKVNAFATSIGESYDQTKFNSYFYQWVQGDYLHFAILRGGQNSYAWTGVYKISTNAVVALSPPHRSGNGTTTNQRWCGYHTSQPNLGSDWPSWENHDLVSSSGPGSGGANGYLTTLSGAITDTQTTLTLTSNTPTSSEPETTLGAFAAGDELWLSGSEAVYLTSLVSGTTWNISRGNAGTVAVAHSNGATVRAGCRSHDPGDYTNAAIMTWNFLADPDGNDPTGVDLFAINNGVSGHYSFANGRMGGSGWKGCTTAGGDPSPCASQTWSNSPAFGGVTWNYGGNAGMMHFSSVHQSNAATAEKVWGLDHIHPYGDPGAVPASVTNVTGSLFKVTTAVTLDIKTMPLVFIVGLHRTLDISSTTTGNVIGGTSIDNYKHCIARAVNECRLGSVPGDIFVNGPNLTTGSTCPPWITPLETTSDALCLMNGAGSGTQNVLQIGMTEAYSNGKLLRALTHGLAPLKQISSVANAQASTDGGWASFLVWGNDNKFNLWNVQVPPWPGYDSVDRNTFLQKSITVADSTDPTATNAVIEFGYNPNFYCKERNEVCVSAAGNNPYFFASESFSGVSCASGCTVSIPMLPDRVAYYRIKWRNSSNTVVQTSGTSIVDAGSGGGGATICRWNTTPACGN